jgi:meso-butanediol dehydrogenase / (S,S)-butanediol dehydrogenase / diacetyl reductase
VKRFKDKVAIVTGAGRGLGKAVALRLAQEGAHVVIAEYDSITASQCADEVRALGVRALAYPIDLSDASQIQPMIDATVREFGRVDFLINNAGRVQSKQMLDIAPEDWDAIADVNERALFFCVQAAAKQMIAQIPAEVRAAGKAPHSYGKIVNFSSGAGRSGKPLMAHYAATKAAVISITRSAALALAPYNINVNAVAPGIAPTQMWDEIDAQRAKMFNTEPGEAYARALERIPLRRAATPEDIAAAVAFLCSADSDYITGQTLNVDGGMEMD